MNTVTRIQKLVTFTPRLYNSAEEKARRLGVPFAEYVRHLIMKDVEDDAARFPLVDAETNRQIGLSLKDLKEGRFVDVIPTDKVGLNKLAGLK